MAFNEWNQRCWLFDLVLSVVCPVQTSEVTLDICVGKSVCNYVV